MINMKSRSTVQTDIFSHFGPTKVMFAWSATQEPTGRVIAATMQNAKSVLTLILGVTKA